jgi:exopolyphosphatase/pppGpp-phosphohydrolase
MRTIAVAMCLLLPSAAAAQPICAIDMGSNSFRRILGSFANGKYTQTVDVVTVGVGDDLAAHGRISDAKLVEIERTLSRFKASCDKAGAARISAIGTAAFREAPNANAVVTLAKRLGIPMEVATERRESELAYLVGSLGRDGYAVIDNGSRSIELVARENGEYRYLVFNLGYRVAYEQFFARAADGMSASRALDERLKAEGSRAPFMKGKQKLIGVEFGDMTEVLFARAPLERRVLTLEALKARLRQIVAAGPGAFAALKKRKDIDRALPRLVVAVSMMEALGYTELELTERELGAGLIVEAGLQAVRSGK